MGRGVARKAALALGLLAAGLAALPAEAQVSFGVGVGPHRRFPAHRRFRPYRPWRTFPYYGWGPPVVYRSPVIWPPPVVYAPPPPFFYTPPPLIAMAPPPPPPGQAPAPRWYWCDNPAGYYPHVPHCMTEWRPVPATPH